MASIFPGELKVLKYFFFNWNDVSSRRNSLVRRSLFYICYAAENARMKHYSAKFSLVNGLLKTLWIKCSSFNFGKQLISLDIILFFVFCLSAYLIGKIFMYMFVANLGGDIAFAVVYIYSAELFPTTVR